jgi:hypothetical protein
MADRGFGQRGRITGNRKMWKKETNSSLLRKNGPINLFSPRRGFDSEGFEKDFFAAVVNRNGLWHLTEVVVAGHKALIKFFS